MASRRIVLVAGLALGVALGVVLAQGVPTVWAAEASHTQLAQRARRLIAERSEVIDELLSLISSKDPTVRVEDRVEAIDLLGDLHATTPRVVVTLGENLLLRRPTHPGPMIQLPSLTYVYPALGAMGQVGLPAAPWLVHKIGMETDGELRERYRRDLVCLVGGHAPS
jgi:hypothetical protein